MKTIIEIRSLSLVFSAWCAILFFSFSSFAVTSSRLLGTMESSINPIVVVENGHVRGLKAKTVLNNDYLSFRGIPYMKPPLGKLRFREAQAPQNWSEVFDATQEGPAYCMTDFMTGRQDGQENAGTINVYTKNLAPAKLLPVMVWVHGGGFSRGSSRTDLYGPDYLLEKDVVFVSFNYRLGCIGFLSLSDPTLEIPGNQGLKDQVFALKWIRNNISKFGGDPNQCTVFGESAGASSVHYLTITELTNGLFQRAIMMSGSAFNKTWSLTRRNNQAERLASNLGWKGKAGDEKSILEFLESVSPFELDDASKTLHSDEEIYGLGLLVPFGPIVEPYITDNCFLPKEPVDMARETWSNSIDFIVMGTSFEGILRAFVGEDKAAKVLMNPSYFAPLLELGLSPNDGEAKSTGESIKKLYYKKGEEPSVENQEQYLRFTSDIHFWHGLYRVVQSRNINASGKTYLMYFDVDAALNCFKAVKKAQHIKGTSHADDLFYLFTTDYHEPPAIDSREFQTIKRMIGLFTSFAITGNPNCREVANVVIEPCDGSTPTKCLSITADGVTEILLPGEENLKVWNSIYEAKGVQIY